MEPSYTVVPLLDRSSIKPGETIQIDLYVVGSGPIEGNKLHLTHGYSDLLDADDPGRWIHSIAGTPQEDGEVMPEAVPSGHPLKSRELSRMGGYTQLNPAHFLDTSDLERQEAEGTWEDVDGLPGIYGERAVVPEGEEPIAPLRIEYNTNQNASAGDYEINLVFTYKGPDKFDQAEKTVPVHVENLVEQNRTLLRAIAAIAAIFTVISIVFPFVASII